MAERSKIEWTESTWTPVRARHLVSGKVGWHCEHVSEGCRNCYAEGINRRLGTGVAYAPGYRQGHLSAPTVKLFLDEKMLLQPLRWRRPRMIFVGSMTDLFAEFVTDDMLDWVFAIMALCRQHTFQLLTKRPSRMRSYLCDPLTRDRIDVAMDDLAPAHWCSREIEDFGGWPLRNVWLGTSCEDQATADSRISDLLATPAAIRFVSAEPLLGPIDFNRIVIKRSATLAPDMSFSALQGWYGGAEEERTRLNWIIVGGESGPHARPMHPQWAREIRDQCQRAGVSFYFKQWGAHRLGEYEEAISPCIQWQTGASEFYDEHQDIKYGDHWLEHSESGRVVIAYPTSKKLAGRLLDGVEHNGMPPHGAGGDLA